MSKEKSERIRPSEHPTQGENVKTLRWDHRLQRQNIFMAFKRVLLCTYVFYNLLVSGIGKQK